MTAFLDVFKRLPMVFGGIKCECQSGVHQFWIDSLGATAGPHTGRFAVANLPSSATDTVGQANRGTRQLKSDVPLGFNRTKTNRLLPPED